MALYRNPTPGDLFKIAGLSKRPKHENDDQNQQHGDYTKENDVGNFAFIFDWSDMSYKYMSQSVNQVLGYEPRLFLNNGYDFTLSLIHPDDTLVIRDIHIAIFKCYYQTAIVGRSLLRFSYNIRVRSDSGKYIKLLRQSKFFDIPAGGRPRLESVNSTDISDFYSHGGITLLIHLCRNDGSAILLHRQLFSICETSLSRREEQVLSLASEGYTSKQIAEIMFVSIETIKSHRKNIIAKTSTRNLIEAFNLLKGDKMKI